MERRILIVEDEITLANLIAYNLKLQGFITETEGDGREALRKIVNRSYDLILLDIMLPNMNGIEITAQARQHAIQTPIIMLTAKTSEEEVIEGLNAGADDYITKPFGIGELIARVNAALRRKSGEIPQEKNQGEYQFENLLLSKNTYEVYIEGVKLELRPKEFELLYYFIKRPNMVLSRDEMIDKIWGYDFIGEQRTIDVHISSLRKKIESPANSRVTIESIRGVGYKLAVQERSN